MSSATAGTSPVQLVQSLFDAFSRGDIPYILARVAPNCRWVAPGKGIPSAGNYTGPEGAAEFFRKLDQTTEFIRFEPREYVSTGNTVVALGSEEMRAKNTGKTASTAWAMLFRVADGKVTEWEGFYDTEAEAAAYKA
jgi:hypothetical protein